MTKPLLPLRIAAWRGWCGRCPQCDKAPLFARFLKQVTACPKCGAVYGDIRADDAPPWLTILITGHLIAPPLTATELAYDPPLWFSMSFWPILSLVLAMLILPRAKGLFIGILWQTQAASPDDGIRAEDFDG